VYQLEVDAKAEVFKVFLLFSYFGKGNGIARKRALKSKFNMLLKIEKVQNKV
jgi:hypothetical protein